MSNRDIARVGLCGAMLFGAPAYAVNPEFQNFFFDVCGAATGPLATRCGETDGGLGNLSGDSESSLNPSQVLAPGTSGEAASRLREQSQQHPGDASADPQLKVDVGPFSILLNASMADESFDRTVDQDEERGYDSDSKVLQLGMDYRVNDQLLLGALLHWQDATLDFDRELPGREFEPVGRAGEVQQDALGGSLFASLAIGSRQSLDLVAGYLDSDFDIERRALFQESNRVIATTAVSTTASTDGSEWFAGLHWNMSLNRGAWQMGPHLGLDYLSREVSSYQEQDLTGSGLALDVGSTEFTETRLTAGWRTAVAISGQGYVLLPQLQVAYAHHLNQDLVAATVSLREDAAGTAFNFQGDRRDSSYFELGIGAVAVFTGGWSAFIEWRTVTGRDDYDRSVLAAGLRVEL